MIKFIKWFVTEYPRSEEFRRIAVPMSPLGYLAWDIILIIGSMT